MATSTANATTATSFAGANLGESHFFDESMHPSTIVTYLTNTDPTNTVSSNNYYLQAMKWLLASMSKGRDVSDFFPHVVKLVSISNLEIRKMVYIFLIQYADHNDACRELCLLSINGFQRGLGDGEQLIRALALRVMSSIRVMDILQIQILAIQKCAKDTSPYVRKCAANAICKVFPFCSTNNDDGDHEAQSLLRDVVKHLLEEDVSTMVLTSAMIAFHETCFPNNLEILHQSFRKLCHLLTDMDEWGQVICMEVLMTYCRTFFMRPPSSGDDTIDELEDNGIFGANAGSSSGIIEKKKKVKKNKKAFYSDEEDSSDDDDDDDDDESQEDLVFIQPVTATTNTNFNNNKMNITTTNYDELDVDHKLLLQSSWPLLKSRNSAVVLGVCSLHYYCSGKEESNTRHAIGKSLVRICRDKREISFVVLQSIKCLIVKDSNYCQVFVPFINDFFIKATDPSFTRILKIEILTKLALEERSINTILMELKSYVRHHDKVFVQTSIEAIATICETSFHRHSTNDTTTTTKESSFTICLNCLYGLTTLTYVSLNALVVGQAVISICHIFRLLLKEKHVNDINSVRAYALKRVVYLFLKSLEILSSDNHHPTNDEGAVVVVLQLPSMSLASCIYILGELWSSSNKLLDTVLEPTNPLNIQIVILQLLIESFTDLEVTVKLPAIHLATKLFVLHKLKENTLDATNNDVVELAEALLSLARLDINQDIRDRARFESQVLQSSIGFTFHTDTLHTIATYAHDKKNYMAKSMFLNPIPPFNTTTLSNCNSNDLKDNFRFGTLSSFVHHSTQSYHDLPPWASRNSPTTLRDPPDTTPVMASVSNAAAANRKFMPTTSTTTTTQKHDNFYASSSEDDDDSSSLESSSSDEDSQDDESSASSSSDEDESSSDDSVQQSTNTINASNNDTTLVYTQPSLVESTSSAEDDSSSEEEDDDDDDSTSSVSHNKTPSPSKTLLLPTAETMTATTNDTTTLAQDLQGLIMTPLVHDTSSKSSTANKTTKIQQDEENNSSQYYAPIKQELSGGLFFQMRYLRNIVKNKQLGIMNLKFNPSSFVLLLQLTFENRYVSI